MAKHAGIPWDLILSAELARHYKPDREAYLTAVSLLELKPNEVMMCAADSTDLIAARECGLSTGFIHRPDEFGSMRKADEANPRDFDVVSTNMMDFASKLGTYQT
jgi:2-haloacid dehalogenase